MLNEAERDALGRMEKVQLKHVIVWPNVTLPYSSATTLMFLMAADSM
jgi:hypothetical protein